jgi:predicted RNA polymerase sigma factor
MLVVLSPPITFSLEHMLHAEHARLVRLCAYLTGDRDAADDLAQETLIKAWRHRHKLTDPDGPSAGLNAIARNVVCVGHAAVNVALLFNRSLHNIKQTSTQHEHA